MHVSDFVAALERFYGPLPAPPSDPFRYYVWEVLSAHTTPGRRDAAYAALLKIPALTPDAMFRAPRGRLSEALAHAGPYQEQRMHALLLGVEQFRRQPAFGATVRGALPRARRLLATLPRLGDGGVHRMLLFGGQHCVVPIDRDVARLASRLAGEDARDRQKPPRLRPLRRMLEAGLTREEHTFRRAAQYLRHHAVQTCVDDPHCSVCPLGEKCPSRREGGT
ncbi:MAG: hypothetical protein ABL982_04635 [Vicinamibacterales bacterium]